MSIPFGFHVVDISDGGEYFPGEDPDQDPWYEGDDFDDDPDFEDSGDHYEDQWEDQLDGEENDYEPYEAEDNDQPALIHSRFGARFNARRRFQATVVGSKKPSHKDRDVQESIARLRAVAGEKMSTSEDRTAHFGPENVYALEILGTDDTGREVSVARYNDVIIGLIMKSSDEWMAQRIDGKSLPKTHDFQRSICYLLEDYIRSLLESMNEGVEWALTTKDPIELMADVEKTAAILAKVISDYRHIAPKAGANDGLPVEKFDPTDVPWDESEPPF